MILMLLLSTALVSYIKRLLSVRMIIELRLRAEFFARMNYLHVRLTIEVSSQVKSPISLVNTSRL